MAVGVPVQGRPRRMAAVSRHALGRDSVQNQRQRFTSTSAGFAESFISYRYCSPSDSRAFSTASVSSSEVLQILLMV
ncbi:hypothetical protein N7489_009108 [Penicillium chrysogenum]|uniref:Uncharacterized protein n=1 Tax=Penicillium chrysogenum TaxID=5076 RepID=A0ABQ8WY49_PENCH|nr:uncharacterized protein N7489_009108 [Penicillium chrysogenum]KAJ5228400.1 hypothetical protein N7489_009108 [Penicillium chrysogenum]KAJ5257799.1 hypothetical protein N7524_009355 [Penicillium chrysogenum]KAJ5283965.1 hypothetical protein N7505_001945 [Penicillium chrysogenum]KAJ6167916.1 hypothetical protein N7497_000759 [Penicillium chrysogenum]